MTRTQYMLIAASMILLGYLYFGVSHKPPKLDQIERTRALSAEMMDISTRISTVKEELNPEEMSMILVLEQEHEQADNDSSRISSLKSLSSAWFELGYAEIAGHYAKEAAKLENTGEAWSIAGSTFVLARRRAPEERIAEYCQQHAIQCFENAISLEPDTVRHRINLALRYVDAPPQENPMKGVLMLRELNESYPENVPVIQNLARLAIQTGQLDRAAERLETALMLEPENRRINCMMAEVMQRLNRPSEQYIQKCNKE